MATKVDSTVKLKAGNTMISISPMGEVVLNPMRPMRRVGKTHHLFIDGGFMFTVCNRTSKMNKTYVGRVDLYATNVRSDGRYEVMLKNRFGGIDLMRTNKTGWEKR